MTRPVSGTLDIGNTNVVHIQGVRDAVTETYKNSSTVTVTIKDDADVNLSGESWPVTATYVTGSDGEYRASISSAVSVSDGDRLSAEVTVTDSGITGFMVVPLVAKVRYG